MQSETLPLSEPSNRRPIANVFRRTAQFATRFCVHHRIHPDAISYFSIVAAAIAGLLFWSSSDHSIFLLIAPAFCYLRLWCNMLDGMVAIASGQASARGEILNDLPDRISDVVIFAGVAHSGWMNPFIGYWAAMFALLTAYVGMMGQAVGVQREFSGVMPKPWRMVALHVGAWLTFAAIQLKEQALQFATLTVLDWTCLVVIAGCIQTIAIRLKRILAALRAKTAAH